MRAAINANLPKGYKEGMQYGMLGWFVPHSVHPAGYHCDPRQPVPFVSVASQKNHMAVYLFCVYTDPAMYDWFVGAWKKTGRRLDMGKSCLRFKRLEDLDLDLIGEVVARMPVETFLAGYLGMVPAAKKKAAKKSAKKVSKKAASKKTVTKKPAPKKAVAKKAVRQAPGKKRAAKKARARRAGGG